MRLHSFSVENYRAFVAPTTLALRPLTLLFGYNNVGKSALLRWPALIADSATGKYPGLLALDSEPARKAAFEDLCSRQSEDPQFKFHLTGALSEEGPHIECSYILKDMPGWRHFLSELSMKWRYPDQSEAAELKAHWTLNREPAPDLSQELDIELLMPGMPPQQIRANVQFRGLSPSFRHRRLSNEMREAFDLLTEFFYQVENQVQWLGASRLPPARRIEKRRGGSPPRKISSDGSGAAELLAYDDEQGRSLIERVQQWFRGDGDVPEYRFVVQPVEDHVRLKISPHGNSRVEVDLADVGEGMTQVLPVLVALARADRGEPDDPRLVVIEQPELHLHPRKEAALARYLGRLAQKSAPPTILLETHSEIFLLALQLEVAEGRLDPDRLGVYWVRQFEDGSSIAQPVAIDDLARLQGWPRGVFEEDSELARQLIEARLRRPAR